MKAKSVLRLFGALTAVVMAVPVVERLRPELAKTATPEEFEGAWTGEWNWKKGEVTTLEIRAGRIKFGNLPVDDLASGMRAVSGEGKAEFAREWSTPAPCVVVDALSLPVFPIYITRRKDGLRYDADVVYDRRIRFSRK